MSRETSPAWPVLRGFPFLTFAVSNDVAAFATLHVQDPAGSYWYAAFRDSLGPTSRDVAYVKAWSCVPQGGSWRNGRSYAERLYMRAERLNMSAVRPCYGPKGGHKHPEAWLVPTSWDV